MRRLNGKPQPPLPITFRPGATITATATPPHGRAAARAASHPAPRGRAPLRPPCLCPATVCEAPYILDGLLMNETGRRVREQCADTGGFTDHVFRRVLDPQLRVRPARPGPALEAPLTCSNARASRSACARWSAASNWVSDSQRYHEQSRSDPRIRTPQTFQSGRLAGNV